MKVVVTRVIKTVVASVLMALVALFWFASARTLASADDGAAMFKDNKCVICHGAKADKHFDSTKTDDQLIETALKGRKAEKPPNMPAFGEKGVTADQAKALVTYMKSLK